MRTEREMLDLILGFAREHEQARAVILNGSRVNPNLKGDLFQDYDVVYLVRSVDPFRRNPEIPRYFGDIMILQNPEDMLDPTPEGSEGYTYLMQFSDGNRIDLRFFPVEDADLITGDRLSRVLLDKDGLIGELPPPSEASYLPQKPLVKAFDDCCNEFWWLNPYVAKGLWRGEMIYSKYILDFLMRAQLMKMLTWYFGIQTGFQRSPGKFGRYLQGYLPDDIWARLEATYSSASEEQVWESLFAMGDLFGRLSHVVAETFGFDYPEEEASKVSDYIGRIRNLPKDAKTMD